ncbi:hypothetical protein [Klebsiella phage vB_KpnP_cmc355D]|uniref:Uncharacterized protein n=1 Tax=Klebsiella phage vB_KpnP_cmc355D TaxID=3110534 RepID=A0ABZ0ZXG6_9CAUD|nr:hypothetical protein [Klebsiella phage vB_KpnP_cmc355D]
MVTGWLSFSRLIGLRVIPYRVRLKGINLSLLCQHSSIQLTIGILKEPSVRATIKTIT